MEASVDSRVYVVDFVGNRIYRMDIWVYRPRRPFYLSFRYLSHLLRNRNHRDAIVQFDERRFSGSMLLRMDMLDEVSHPFLLQTEYQLISIED